MRSRPGAATSYFFIPLVLGPLNSLKLWSTYPPQRYSMFDSGKNNKQHNHHLSLLVTSDKTSGCRWSGCSVSSSSARSPCARGRRHETAHEAAHSVPLSPPGSACDVFATSCGTLSITSRRLTSAAWRCRERCTPNHRRAPRAKPVSYTHLRAHET